MDSPKPLDVWGSLISHANTASCRLEAKDDSVFDQESNVSLQLSLSCYKSKEPAIVNKGKERVSSEGNFEVAVGAKTKSRSSSSSGTTNASLELGLSVSGDSTIMSKQKKETIRFLDAEDSRGSEGLSLKLTLGPSDACSSTSKKRTEPESKRRVSLCNNKKAKIVRKEETMTELRLSKDPWRIKKKLCVSDIGHLSRLLLASDLVKSHVFPYWSEDQRGKVEEGLPVMVWDCDTKEEFELVFKQWNKGGANVLKKNWPRHFVHRRELKSGDEIGLYWDEKTSRFKFSVLSRA